MIDMSNGRAHYSYRKDSIGSNLAAFIAGYKPDTSPTTVQVNTAIEIHIQGNKKEPPMK